MGDARSERNRRRRFDSSQTGVAESKRALLDFLIGLRRDGKHVVGYGAPGKGNTLLNYCGIRTDLLDYTVDRNPYKQGAYTPGTRIPIEAPERIDETQPGLHPHPALEPRARDQRPAAAHRHVGCEARRSRSSPASVRPRIVPRDRRSRRFPVDMKVLVTGHAGYIGSVLAAVVEARGHHVVGLDTHFYADCDLGSPQKLVPGLALDVRDVTPEQLLDFDAVVHLAALSNDPLGDLAPEVTFEINLEAAVLVARAARDAGVRRFIFASSCSMYGASDSDDALDEDAPLHPLTPYAESKVRAEQQILALATDDFCAVSMRNATVYGASSRLRLDIVLNNLTAWAHTTGRIRLLSDGSAWRPLVHVRDLASVACALLDCPASAISGQALNIGSTNQNYRIRDLADVVGAITGCEVEYANSANIDPRSYRVDFRKLERTLPELRLEWDAERGARELLDAYGTNGLAAEAMDGRAFIRLRQLRHLLDEQALDPSLRWQPGCTPVVADQEPPVERIGPTTPSYR